MLLIETQEGYLPCVSIVALPLKMGVNLETATTTLPTDELGVVCNCCNSEINL